MLFFNIFIVILFVSLCLKLLYKNFSTAYYTFPYMFQGITGLLSLLYIESGGYVSELDVYGHFNYASLVYFIFLSLSLLIIYNLVDKIKLNEKYTVSRLKNEENIIEVTFVIILVVLYINLLLSPIPLISSTVDRIEFWKYARFPFLNKILGNSSAIIAFSFGLLKMKSIKRSNIYFFLYFAYLILLGNKFSALLTAIYLYFLPSVVYHQNVKFSLKKLMNPKLILVASIFIGIIAYHYSTNHFFKQVVGDSVLLSILYRAFGLQGHVWWGTFEKVLAENYTPHFEVSHMWNGMHYLMRMLSPSKYIDLSIQRGVSMTNGYPAIIVYIFSPYIALVIHAVFMSIVGIISRIHKYFLSKNGLISIVLIQIISWLNYMFFMGYFNKTIMILIFSFISLWLFIIFSKFKMRESDG